MTKQLIIITLGIGLFLFSLSFSSCSKERLESQDELNSYEPIDDYLNEKKQDEQEFVIDTSGTAPIVGNQGTKIWIAKNLLMFPDSSDVEWPFTVKLVELYTPKDMIYYQMPTVASGNILETEGEVRVRAFKVDDDGIEQELLLKPNRNYALEMPSDSIRDNLKVYYGYETNSHSNWTVNVTSIGGNLGDDYFSPTANGHRANIGKLGWINCGNSHQGFNNITFTSETDHLENVGIFTYDSKYKSVTQARNMITDEFPDSLDIKIILIARNSSNELYHSYLQSTITGSGSINITLEPISDADLTSILDNL